MYECYECGVDRGGSGMREDGNCIDCGPVTKKKLKHRVEELIEVYDRLAAERDRLAAENAELRKEADAACEETRNIFRGLLEFNTALAAANATLDALREAVPEILLPHMSWKGALDAVRAILYPERKT